ncbi:hypothetical protein SAMD00019534_067760 [Acytostelium subglobosum LB1]|uniref:hypothetical protein n=1 Tax=Acytostelium subglobosum LB1 TaxID=1410327 RepID=UPI0006451A93|nr:hypothetical protein SAMD00019534_067760 [Acytostelium subglobosum LB1]GAM23601.1 hypothetical protein SAMD00019534_067760 [Acytostelium subglobosum LB1]|eukprot:XP_012753342.1 hypothetical protein SAMD00019534_067760 [Acytostelium subglobosum LB1]
MTIEEERRNDGQDVPLDNRGAYHGEATLAPPDDLHHRSIMYLRTPSDDYLHYEDMTNGQKFLENVFGYTVANRKAKIPSGYDVAYTESGQPHLVPTMAEAMDATDIAAMNEHVNHGLTMRCSMRQIEETFGTGIYLYFDFVKFCNWTNLLLLAVVLVNVVPHLYYEDTIGQFKGFRAIDYVMVAINLQSYIDARSRAFYYWSSVAAIGLTFLMGPVYALKVHRYFKNRNLTDFEDGFDDDNEIKGNQLVSRTSRLVRFITSYAIFVILIISSAVCNLYVIRIINSHPFLTGLLTTSLVSSIVIRFFNVIYDFLCLYLTKLEKHRTWTNFRTHNTLKLYVFKVVNVLVLYLLRSWVFSSYTYEIIYDACPLVDVGSQFLLILLLDLTLQNVWEIVYSCGMAAIGKCIGKRGKKSTDSYRPEFDLAEEYLEILYRQLIVYLGLTIYPLVALLGVLCGIVEIYVDKFRMLKVCRRPHRIHGSMKKFLTMYLLMTAAVAVATFPYGSGWVLFEMGLERGQLHDKCPFLFSRQEGSHLIIPLTNTTIPI